MRAEDYKTQTDEIEGWKVNVVTYRIGDRCYCQIDNVSPGARIARAEASTREEAEKLARDDAARRLARQRRMEV
ncbi:MAG TPA: hypothetical protein VGR66_12275 [Candidatus Eisenbacteria bacterium]|nr:hypothetical protein [Candidatus Eisenbacteria bacterium]